MIADFYQPLLKNGFIRRQKLHVRNRGRFTLRGIAALQEPACDIDCIIRVSHDPVELFPHARRKYFTLQAVIPKTVPRAADRLGKIGYTVSMAIIRRDRAAAGWRADHHRSSGPEFFQYCAFEFSPNARTQVCPDRCRCIGQENYVDLFSADAIHSAECLCIIRIHISPAHQKRYVVKVLQITIKNFL